jgi:hypothetical protein
MGSIFKKPKTPKLPDPVKYDPPPTPVDPAVTSSAKAYRRRVGALARQTVLTQLAGLEPAVTTQKSLLGS